MFEFNVVQGVEFNMGNFEKRCLHVGQWPLISVVCGKELEKGSF